MPFIDEIKRYVVERRETNIDGINVAYNLHICPDNEELPYVDSEGNIYLSLNSELLSDFKQPFQDLMALHETLEWEWLYELGLPKPRYSVDPDSIEALKASQVHNQVHFLELMAARDMGILTEYVIWRPHEQNITEYGLAKPADITELFYQKLES